MREMLDPDAFESFRVKTLDLISKIREVIRLTGELEARRISQATMEPALAELLRGLTDDPVAIIIDGDAVDNYADASKRFLSQKSIPLREFGERTRHLLDRIYPTYLDTILAELNKCYDFPDRKVKKAKIINAYLSFLINNGYNKTYLFNAVIKRFFDDDILKVDARSLIRFSRLFSLKDRRFRLYMPVPRGTGTYLSRLELNFMSIVEQGTLQAALNAGVSKIDVPDYGGSVLAADISKRDEHSALEFMNDVLLAISSLTFLQKKTIKLTWPSKAYVKAIRSHDGILVSRDGFLFQRSVNTVSGSTGRRLELQTKAIMSEFDSDSTERILSATGTVALARSSANPENQLISLWSSVEVLLSDPPEGKSRISHYVERITPCICLTYPRRYLSAVCDELLVHHPKLTRDALKKVLVVGASDQHTKFMHLVFSDQYEDARIALLQSCESNPLAAHRVWKLRDAFVTGSDFLQSVESHEDRVRWQIARIYRARNDLVHAGRRPTYINSLVLNAFEYFRTAFVSILAKATGEMSLSDIDQIVTGIGVAYEIEKAGLRKDKRVAANLDIQRLGELFSKI